MARRINLSQIGGYAEEKMEKLLRAVVLETDSRLKQESPVDTGRFRLSWAISEQGTPGYDAGPQTSPTGITPPRKLDYQSERLGSVYHIHNSLPYAYRLAYKNWSKQAPAGWPDRIAREMQAYVQQQADRIGRED